MPDAEAPEELAHDLVRALGSCAAPGRLCAVAEQVGDGDGLRFPRKIQEQLGHAVVWRDFGIVCHELLGQALQPDDFVNDDLTILAMSATGKYGIKAYPVRQRED